MNIVNLYSTKHMEDALQALAKVYQHVVFNRCRKNEFGVRLRMSQVVDVNWYFHSPGHAKEPANASQLQAWKENGGIMVDTYDIVSSKYPLGDYDALLFSECPTSLYRLEAACRGVQHCTIVYAPPDWSEHEKTLYKVSPSPDDVRRFYDVAIALGDERISDDDMRQRTGVESVAAIRLFLQEFGHLRRQRPIIRVKLLYTPDQSGLMPMAQFILKHPIADDGWRHIPMLDLKDFNRRYNFFLKELYKQGALEKASTLYSYTFWRHKVNWEMIARKHRMLIQEFRRIQELIQSAPEFPAREILAGRIEYESPLSEARFDGTVRLARPAH